MPRSKIIGFEEAARLVPDGAVVAASSSSGLACPDRMLAAIGERFAREGHPQNLTFFLPIAAGMYGIKGIDHVAPDLRRRARPRRRRSGSNRRVVVAAGVLRRPEFVLWLPRQISPEFLK